MEYHRNPSPPDSPRATSESHDITMTSLTNAAHDQSSGSPDRGHSSSGEKSANDGTSLVDYDDRIGDTVFSKAWVLSLLVKAIEAVREQESKIEIFNHSEGDKDERDMEKSELSIEDRQNVVSNRTIQPDSGIDTSIRGDSQIMGMESLECDQTGVRDRPMFIQNVPSLSSVPDRSDGLGEASHRDTQPRARIDDEKDSMTYETSPAFSDGGKGEIRKDREGERVGGIRRAREGERRGGSRESGEFEGEGEGEGDDDDGLVDQRDRSSLLGDGADEVSESLENDLCRLWDASMNMEVAQFIHEQHGVELLLGVANRSTAPRLTEICIGLLGNMACSEDICIQGLSSSSQTVQILVQFMESSDTRILYETSRLILTCLSHEKCHPVWLGEIQQSEVMYPAMIFILQGSTNTELLQSAASLLDRLLDSSEQLLSEWATSELVEAVCEAAEQVRLSCIDAACSLLMTLQLLSTVDRGVEAIVECESKVLSLLHSFLNGLEHLEGHCSPVMAAISLCIALRENSSSDQVKDKLKDASFTHTVQRISEQAQILSQQSNEEEISSQYSELHVLILKLL